MQYIPKNLKIKLEWQVMKGIGNVEEDFSRSRVYLFLVSDKDRWSIPCTATNKVTAELPETLEEGVYHLELVWYKNENTIEALRSVQRTRKSCVFCVDAATPSQGSSAILKVQTIASTYGYDGLSAYEIAVMRGKTSASEDEWASSQGGGGGSTTVVDNTTTADRNAALSANQGKLLADEVASLKAGLDGLLWEGSKVVVSGGGLMAASGASVTIVATFDSPTLVAETLILVPPNAQQMSVNNNNTIEHSTTLKGAGDYKFTATAFYKDGFKSGETTVSLRNKVYCGMGASLNDVIKDENALSLRKSAAGTYSKTASANGQYFFLVVPNDVTKPSVFTMGGAPVAMASSTQSVNGVNCTVFKSGASYDKGTSLTIKAE